MPDADVTEAGRLDTGRVAIFAPANVDPMSPPTMTAFATFALLYMTALFLELAEKWSYPRFTLSILLLILVIFSTRITRVTFQLCLWTRAAATIPMVFEYQGRIHSTEDIVKDPVWRTDARDWEMVLMDFGIIQPEGPNRCRW